MLIPIFHSFVIAITSSAIAFALMLPLAYAGAFVRYPGKIGVEIGLLLPLVLPPTVIGLYLLQLLGKYGPLASLGHALIFSLSGSILATTLVILPIVYQGLKSAILSVSGDLIDEGKMAGASKCQLLWHILLPNSQTIVVASLLLAFCRALGEFGASLMVAGYIPGMTDTVANTIYFATQNGDTQLANLLAAVNLLFGALTLVLLHFISRKK
ncbi:MAG: ABC transporter permease subunit [Streptococcaceae bacterium]|jgi:molybdate transport system permease protein|nr:ABC transporter permease subunit [Streptococcaceae bacterium]